MGMEPMTVRAEVWPVAADEIGLWLVSGGDAWRSDAVPADGDVHFEVEMLLGEHGVTPADIAAVHSTSWRPDGPAVVLTYMAVINPGGMVFDRWPDALPITADLADSVGKPPVHAATAPPVPRYVDVLLHGIRHLRFLVGPEGDRETAAALDANWRRHLAPLKPALAEMFSERLAG